MSDEDGGSKAVISSVQPCDGSKSVFIFKPTDTCLSELKSLAKSASTGASMQLKVTESDGVFLMPNGREFAISQHELDGQNTVDVLCQLPLHFLDVGAVSTRIQVAATNDVYVNTKTKAKLANEEAQKKRAKEIKNDKFDVKGKLSKAMHTVSSSSRPLTPLGELSATGSSSKVPSKTKMQFDPSKRTLRQRIIQLLAVKQYNKEDIGLRLMQDGLAPGEQDNIGKVLSDVGVLHSHGKYSLKGDLHGEILRDWPPYTPYDRQLVQKLLDSRVVKPESRSQIPVADSEQAVPAAKRPKVEPVVGPSEKELREAESQLTPVQTVEQREEYRRMFDRDYKDYIECYKRMEEMAAKFRDLAENLNKSSGNKQKAIKREICSSYEQLLADPGIQEVKRKHDLLRVKLQRLKQLVKDFDAENSASK